MKQPLQQDFSIIYWYFLEISSELECMESNLHSPICPHGVMLWQRQLNLKCANYNLHHINRHQEQCQLNCIRWTHTRILFCTYYMLLRKIILSEYTTDFLHSVTSLQPNCLSVLHYHHTHCCTYIPPHCWTEFITSEAVPCHTDDWFRSGCRYIMILHCVACSCRICVGGYVCVLLVQNLSWQPVLHRIFHSTELVITSYPVLRWILLVSSMCCASFLLLYLCCISFLFGM